MGSLGIPVMVTSREVVPPRNTTEKHTIPFSNLDLLIPLGFHAAVYFCYKKPPQLSTMSDMEGVLREALAETLSSFYVFAGEVVENSRGEPESLCNNRGVDFLHAFANSELKDIDFTHPDFSIQGKFIPLLRQGIFSAQVTTLRCGGLVIGCIFDHRVADAYSANMFLRSWAENAQQKPETFYTPNLSRSLLSPRTPLQYLNSIHKWYTYVSPNNDSSDDRYHHHHLDLEEDQFTSRTFYIDAEQIKSLQKQASSNGKYHTKYESFTSFLWQTLAHSLKDNNDKLRLSIAVDGRARLFYNNQTSKDQNIELTKNYFGNLVSFPFTKAKAKDLKEITLSEAADLVHQCKEETTKSEHFFGLVDWIEMHKPSQPVTRIVYDKADQGATVLVSSGIGFPILEMDFGWGKPCFGSYYNPFGEGIGGYVMPMPSAKGNGDWVVYMHLTKRQIDVIEKISGHVLKPLVPGYLSL